LRRSDKHLGNALHQLHQRILTELQHRRFQDAGGWRPIETAPLMQMVWLWAPSWRHAFPGQRNGDFGAVYVDTCETEARGWQTFATHWQPLPVSPTMEPTNAQ